MAKKKLVLRDPFNGLSYGIDALIRNEGTTIEEVDLNRIDTTDLFFQIGNPLLNIDFLKEVISKFGQKSPVVLRLKDEDKWQIVTGFSRVFAVQKAGLKTVNARLFDYLKDEDAIKMAIIDAILYSRITIRDIENFELKIRNAGIFSEEVQEVLNWARSSIDRISVAEEKPIEGEENREEKIGRGTYYLGELIDMTFNHLSEASIGLERIFENWSDVSTEEKRIIAAECKYIHDLYPFLLKGEE